MQWVPSDAALGDFAYFSGDGASGAGAFVFECERLSSCSYMYLANLCLVARSSRVKKQYQGVEIINRTGSKPVYDCHTVPTSIFLPHNLCREKASKKYNLV